MKRNELVKAKKLSLMNLQVNYNRIAKAQNREDLIPSRELNISRIEAVEDMATSELQEWYEDNVA